MEQLINDFFAQYAYQPWLVYGGIVLFMAASAFGLPLPEEVVLISAGLIGAKAMNPELYPPPTPDASRVNPYLLAVVALLAVMGSDYLIYWIGKRAGPRLFRTKFFSRFLTPATTERIKRWVNKYGYWAVILFRFTPGVRFPGHLMCGAMGLSAWKFAAVDFIAAGLSVPTQILLLCFYGEEILGHLRRYKLMALSILAAFLAVWIVRKLIDRWREQRA